VEFSVLSERAKWRVTGADRVRFLNGQTTNDVREATAEATQESCLLNAKGHLDAHLFLFASEDAIWIDADGELREPMRARLERYLIADDVEIADQSDEFALFHILAKTRPEIAPAKFCLRSRRLANEGWDVWTESERAEEAQQLLARSYRELSSAAWEQMRIEEGIPRWGHELNADVIPPEANLDARAIDYEKGCYLGQEIISRMKMSGQTRQRLCGLVSAFPLQVGMELRANDKMVGRISSAVFSPRFHSHLALAMIKRGATDAGTEMNATFAGQTVRAQVAVLPFASHFEKR